MTDQSYVNFMSAVDSSGWLKHIRTIIEGVYKMVRAVAVDGANILVHCSDGWDRTAQLCSLAMLCLDPYYRTARGFMVLIEKEWLSVGYKFSHRTGHLVHGKLSALNAAFAQSKAAASVGPNNTIYNVDDADVSISLPSGLSISASQHHHFSETSPVFLQFLDVTWQLLQQFPDQFEFTGTFLRSVYTLCLSGETGTFIHNCERERRPSMLQTLSSWTVLLQTMGDSPYGPDAWPSTAPPATAAPTNGLLNVPEPLPLKPHHTIQSNGSPLAYYNPRYSGLANAQRVIYPSASGTAIRYWRAMYSPNEGMTLLATIIASPPPSKHEQKLQQRQEEAQQLNPAPKATASEQFKVLCPSHRYERLVVPGPSFADEIDDATRVPTAQTLDDLRRRVAWCKRFLLANGTPIPADLLPSFPLAVGGSVTVPRALPHPRSAEFLQSISGAYSNIGDQSPLSPKVLQPTAVLPGSNGGNSKNPTPPLRLPSSSSISSGGAEALAPLPSALVTERNRDSVAVDVEALASAMEGTFLAAVEEDSLVTPPASVADVVPAAASAKHHAVDLAALNDDDVLPYDDDDEDEDEDDDNNEDNEAQKDGEK